MKFIDKFSILHFCCAILISVQIKAQDTIFYKNGYKEVVRILEFKPLTIRFLRMSDSSVYNISNENVSKVVKPNGEVHDFVHYSPDKSGYHVDPRAIDFNRNFVSLSITDVFFRMVTIGYERISKSGVIGLKFAASVGHKLWDGRYELEYRYDGYYSRNKLFSIGLDLNIYPMRQGIVRHYFAPSIEYGQFGVLDNYPNQASYKANYKGVFIQNGVLVQFTKSFNMAFSGGFGWISTTGMNRFYEGPTSALAVRLGIIAGYKF